MTVKTFVFCDICNTKGIRLLDDRRVDEREAELGGRRISDGRHWFEGSLNEAINAGWVEDERGRHICGRCHAFLEMDGRARAS